MKTLNKDLAAIQLSQVIEQLGDYDTEAMVNIYNQYADAMSYERINDNDEQTINELYSNPYNALLAARYGDYKLSDDYFYFNNGNLISFNCLTDDNCPIDISELAQWLKEEDKLSEYDITVTALDDMLASIEDNITDDVNMLYKLCDYLTISYNDSSDIKNLVGDCMYKLEGSVTDNMQGVYERLINIINHLNINYE